MAAAMNAYRQHMVSVTGGNANQWIDALDESEEHYYYNTRTREAEWQLPHRAYVDVGNSAFLDERQLETAHRRAHEIAMAAFLEAQLNEAASGSSASQSTTSPPAHAPTPTAFGSRTLRGQRVLEHRMMQDFQCAKDANAQAVAAKCDADLAALFEEPDGIGSKLAATVRAATRLVSPAHASTDRLITASAGDGGEDVREELQYSSQLAQAAEELSRDFDALKQRYTARARGPERILRVALQSFADERMSQVVQALADLHRREMLVQNVGGQTAAGEAERERRAAGNIADESERAARAPSPATTMATAAAAQAMVSLSVAADAHTVVGGVARGGVSSDLDAATTNAAAGNEARAPVNQSPSRSQIDLDSEPSSPPASPAQSLSVSPSRDLTRTFESESLEKSEHEDHNAIAAALQVASEADAKVTTAQEQQRLWHEEALRARELAAEAGADAEAKERHASLLEEQLADERVAAARERARAEKAVKEAAQASAAVARAEAESRELELELQREREREQDSARRQHDLVAQAAIAAGSAELAEAHSAVASARVEADDAIAANVAHAEHIESLQRHATAAAREAESQKKELEEVTEYAHELYRSYEALREKAEGWRAETVEARTRLAEAEERAESLEAEAEALHEEHSQDQAVAEIADPGIGGRILAATDTAVRPSAEALRLAEAAAEAAEAEIDALRVEQINFSRAAAAANDRATAAEAELADRIARHEETVAQLRDAREALAQAVAEKEVRQAELDLLRDRMPMPVEADDDGSAPVASGGERVDTDALVRANTNAAAELAKRQQAIRDAEAQLEATEAQVRRQEVALMAASGAQEAERAERRVLLGASKSNGRSDVEEQLLNELRQRRRGEKRLEAELHEQNEATLRLERRMQEERGTATEMIKLLQDEVRDCQGRFTFPVLFAACLACAVMALLFVNFV